ncbi:hypothetical protein Daura_30660 [Dactylosporangium aurantiacum]|uniref:Uncharacterized protein n=1 Tax=Dactylosporangium aurantiacum TaxID=35754 RepID=A0A9Q9IDE2_9ACTN|nr:hypothetical protein [Dactylosporangium aurantiacum]MDG6108759.1 hypothetical protein [Dactylosporangium aurantiacum]UWZ51118.1 hypothetical protein Daura_30660 [Dactylosporangium aurantiacum]
MFRLPRRSAAPAGVRFCDGCAEVSTAAQRAQRRVERTRTALAALAGPR